MPRVSNIGSLANCKRDQQDVCLIHLETRQGQRTWLITTAPDETTIVTAVISMGRSLNLRVVAEGVETQEELKFLQAHQCDEAQGYYFSRPVLPHVFAQLLKSGIPEQSVVVHRRAAANEYALASFPQPPEFPVIFSFNYR